MLPNDQPPQAVIEDDEAVDNWYKGYLREVARKLARTGRAGAGEKGPAREWKDASDVAFQNPNTRYRPEGAKA